MNHLKKKSGKIKKSSHAVIFRFSPEISKKKKKFSELIPRATVYELRPQHKCLAKNVYSLLLTFRPLVNINGFCQKNNCEYSV